MLIATGSTPLHPQDIPSDAHILDADSFIAALHPIAGVVVIGSGPIRCEYASICAALGTHVTLIDVADRVLGMVDREIAAQLTTVFAGMGVDVRLATTVSGVVRRGEVLDVSLSDGAVVHADRILLATGRAGRTGGLGLEEAGVTVDAKGRVVVDASYRTTAPGCSPPATSSGRPGSPQCRWSRAGWPPRTRSVPSTATPWCRRRPSVSTPSPRSAWPGSPRNRPSRQASTTRLAGRRSRADVGGGIQVRGF